MTRRLHAALLSVLALILGTGALVFTTSGAAHADIDGTVTLTPSSGTITDKPFVTGLSLSAGCPAPYQDALRVSLIAPDGTAKILLIVKDGAPYTSVPVGVTLAATAPTGDLYNSITTALKTVTDGSYPLVVECGLTTPATDQALRTYTTAIQVTGQNWALKQAAPATQTSVTLTADPAGHAVVNHAVTLTANVQPADAAGRVQFMRDGTRQIAEVTVAGGTATTQLPVVANPSLQSLSAVFVPDDNTKYTQSSATASYSIVDEPAVTVLDDTGNALEDTPSLKGGQKISVTADGFFPAAVPNPGEDVDITLDGVATTPATVHTDSTGAVDFNGTVAKALPYTVPSSIADGSHKLTLTGHTSKIAVDFPFTTGAAASSGGTTSGDTAGDTSGDSSGATAGDTSGDSSGATAGDTSGDSSGTSSGTSAGDPPTTAAADTGSSGDLGGSSGDGTSGSGGTSGGGTSGGGGSLAATGATGVLPLTGLALALAGGGGYVVYRVRRDGKLLGFGPHQKD
jgi:hypothetical protein